MFNKAKAAYEAYMGSLGMEGVQRWEDLADDEQEAWDTAILAAEYEEANAVANALSEMLKGRKRG